jgi:hypothetical protein
MDVLRFDVIVNFWRPCAAAISSNALSVGKVALTEHGNAV